jgi:hypothetical protein
MKRKSGFSGIDYAMYGVNRGVELWVSNILVRNVIIVPYCSLRIDKIMIRTKNKDYHQILVDGQNYDELQLRYGASRSFNEVITEILRHHESAVSIIGDCESCKAKFKEAIQK